MLRERIIIIFLKILRISYYYSLVSLCTRAHFSLEHRYYLANASATLVISQEYGVTKEEKITIASSVADNLFYKLHADLANASTGDDENGDTRLDADFIEVSENVRSVFIMSSSA